MSLADSAPISGEQRGAAIPRLAEPSEKSSDGNTTPRAAEDLEDSPDTGKKQKKRGLFGFGKRKEETEKTLPPSEAVSLSSTAVSKRTAASPIRSADSSAMLPSSPSRGLSSSPRLSSPAGSQIFERDVQESAVIPNSPAIPSHIQTENYIPPVLDASSEAITADNLDPDSVEIITHAVHQPAALTVAGVSNNDLSSSWADELATYSEKDDSASNYGSLDTTDVRRLSFISFADVVQAEQGPHAGLAGSRDSMHLAGLTSLSSMNANRSPSPIRSPVSSQEHTSPPTSKSGSVKGLELSPTRKPIGSPTSALHPVSGGVAGELNIETMSQALRRTGSGDLSGVRSLPTSPIEEPSR